MKRYLVVVDPQNDFISVALGDKRLSEPVVSKICDIIEYAKDHKFEKILVTQDTHDDTYNETLEGKILPVQHCKKNTYGWEINTDINVALEKCDNVYRIEKDTFGTFVYKTLNIEEADEIWITGFDTDICVAAQYFIIKTFTPNTPIYVVKDACFGSSKENHEAALRVLSSAHAYVVAWNELRVKTNASIIENAIKDAQRYLMIHGDIDRDKYVEKLGNIIDEINDEIARLYCNIDNMKNKPIKRNGNSG